MEPSLFLELVEQYFPRLVLSITRTINGENREPVMYHRRFLRKQFSLTGKWETLNVANSRVMADVIAMDSSIPLKKRAPLSKATGEIPKIGMEMQLNETQLTNLQLMVRANMPEAQIIEELFRDTAFVINGQYERLEYLFLKGLSAGVVEVDNTDNVGTGVRLDYQYPADHLFNSSLPWANPLATPFADLQPLLEKARADGNPVRRILLDRATWNAMLQTDEAKNLYAVYLGVITGSPIAIPADRFNDAVRASYGFVFEIIERTCRYQINGVDTDVQPWEAGQVIAINNDNLGALVWSELAEMNAPVGGVTYQRADDFILASKYRVIRPSLAEFTASQSRSVPVIGAVNQIYKLDSTQTATT